MCIRLFLFSAGLVLLPVLFTGCLSLAAADNPEPEKPAAEAQGVPVPSAEAEEDWTGELAALQETGDTTGMLALLDEHRTELNGVQGSLYMSLLMAESRLDEAEEVGRELLNALPEDVSVLYMNALIMDMEGRGDEALDLIDRAYGLDASDPDVNLFMAEMELRNKDYRQADKYLSVVLEKEPDNFSALVAKADVLMHLGQGNDDLNKKFLTDAVKVLDRVEEIAPDYVYTYVDRSRALAVLGNTARAMRDLDKAVELEPDVEWHYLDRVVLNLKYFGWLDKAVEDLKTLESINPDNLFAHIYSAGVYDDMGDYDTALSYYERVMAARPDYAYSYEGAGKIYYIKGNFPKAEYCFLKAYELIYPYEGYILMAALAMKNQGDNFRAKEILQDQLKTLDRESLMYEVFRYAKEGGSDFFLTGEIAKETDADARNNAWFYLGELYLLQDSPRSAQAAFMNLSEEHDSFEADIANWHNEQGVNR